MLLFTLFLSIHGLQSQAAPGTYAIAGLEHLKAIGAKIEKKDEGLGVGVSFLTDVQQSKLLQRTHAEGKCAGFEAISEVEASGLVLESLRKQDFRSKRVLNKARKIEKRPEIESALHELNAENLRDYVSWLSSFPSRSHRQQNPNQHVLAMEAKIREIMQAYPHPWRIERVSHRNTQQASLRLHLEGKQRPAEIIVLGGHLDSISNASTSPGADDNASGSANLIEALRVLITQARPERSIEFFWYAGEEGGLLGSSEIAKSYKDANRQVIAVLQLDMTSFPGAGEFVIGNVSDFTSAWLRAYLVSINDLYLGARLIEDRCGYACSDHASWHRQGYPTLMPFESDTETMNRRIHTARDTIQSDISFRHSLEFSKIALIFAMDLGNSTDREN